LLHDAIVAITDLLNTATVEVIATVFTVMLCYTVSVNPDVNPDPDHNCNFTNANTNPKSNLSLKP